MTRDDLIDRSAAAFRSYLITERLEADYVEAVNADAPAAALIEQAIVDRYIEEERLEAALLEASAALELGAEETARAVFEGIEKAEIPPGHPIMLGALEAVQEYNDQQMRRIARFN